MTWFKVDDTLALHPKARAAGNRAMGLWVMSGSMAAHEMTDGYVPRWFVTGFAHGRADAETLVSVGLWAPDSGGWTFHDWNQANPTRTELEATREANRLRVARWRALRNGNAARD